MPNIDEHAVSVLNSLIETTLDSADGYGKAAERADNPQFQRLFSDRAASRRLLCQQLKAEVRSFGGEPKDDGSILGRAHRAFVELRDRVAGHDDKAVIAEVERGEDLIRNKFEQAAHDRSLPEDARQMLERAYSSIKADHDEVSAFKHGMN